MRVNGTVGTADRRTAGDSDADKQRLVGAGIEAGGQERCGVKDACGPRSRPYRLPGHEVQLEQVTLLLLKRESL